MIDILYVSFNRFDMTRESFDALLRNTDWTLVRTLYVHDDGSTDGTAEWLREESAKAEAEVVFESKRLKGPVAAMNWCLDRIPVPEGHSETFAKIDNDFVVCPGWLNDMDMVMYLNPGLDILGMEPMLAPAEKAPRRHPRGFREAEFIGGKGLIRTRAFTYCRPKPGGRNGYQGFTQWQMRHPDVSKGWVDPDLPVFGLDQLPFEPWVSLTAEYEAKGWARSWGAYDSLYTGYWDWWVPKFQPVTA